MKKFQLHNAGNSPLMQQHKTSSFNRSWGMIALIVIIAFAMILWLTGGQRNPTVIPQKNILQETNVQGSTLPVKEITGFISQAKASDVPKTFFSDYLHFSKGSTQLLPGSNNEIEKIAQSLESFPLATIRIEGFSDKTGDLTEQKDLAFKRALAVKEQLVQRGINPDRVDTVYNISANERMQIVVTSVE
jgi:outer membrane protein OmpA-like peptidoglycan-associated protein